MEPENNQERENAEETGEPRRGVTGRRRMLTLINLAFVNLGTGINFAILGPFYPDEAAKKGVSTALVGFIFAEFELIMFFTSPIIGILLPKLGAKFTYTSGIFICGSSCILFGFLVYCPPGAPFIVTTLLVRGVMAVGAGLLVTASFAIIAASFPDNVSAMFGLLETFSGLGLMIGPPVGGALYQVGGFVTPFAVMGVIILCAVPFTMIFLEFDSSNIPPKTGSYRSIILNPHILIASLTLWGTAATIGFVDPILQPFLTKHFNLNHFLVGLVFIVNPAVYALLSPVMGFICDKKPVTKYLMTLSLITTGLSMLFISPSPLFGIGSHKLWITVIALIIFGIGCSATFAPVTMDILREGYLMGLQDNFTTFSLVSGYVSACLSLGFFCGPILGGSLTGSYGFAWSTTIFGFVILALGVLYGIYMIVFMFFLGGRNRVVPQAETREETEEADERTPLLVTA